MASMPTSLGLSAGKGRQPAQKVLVGQCGGHGGRSYKKAPAPGLGVGPFEHKRRYG